MTDCAILVLNEEHYILLIRGLWLCCLWGFLIKHNIYLVLDIRFLQGLIYLLLYDIDLLFLSLSP